VTTTKPLPAVVDAGMTPGPISVGQGLAVQEKRPSLFSLRADQLALTDLLLTADVGEDDTIAAVDKWTAELDAAQGDKVDSYCQIIRHLELNASLARAEQERYAMLAKSRQNAADRLKAALKDHMERTGQKKIETPHNRLSIVANGGAQGVEIPDAALLPDEYIDLVPTPNVAKVRAALQGTKDVAAVEVRGATLKPRGTHLRMA